MSYFVTGLPVPALEGCPPIVCRLADHVCIFWEDIWSSGFCPKDLEDLLSRRDLKFVATPVHRFSSSMVQELRLPCASGRGQGSRVCIQTAVASEIPYCMPKLSLPLVTLQTEDSHCIEVHS